MNRFCSIFSQLLKLFPRTEFQQLVKETGAERRKMGLGLGRLAASGIAALRQLGR